MRAGEIGVERLEAAVVSNADDLARFYTTLMSGHLLAPSLLAQMTTTVDVGDGFRYGLGIYTMTTRCGQVWGHDGGIPGYASFAYTDEYGRRSSVVLLSTQPNDAHGCRAAGHRDRGLHDARRRRGRR